MGKVLLLFAGFGALGNNLGLRPQDAASLKLLYRSITLTGAHRLPIRLTMPLSVPDAASTADAALAPLRPLREVGTAVCVAFLALLGLQLVQEDQVCQ